MKEHENYGILRNQACFLVTVALCLVMTDTLMTQAQDYSAEELARRTLKRRAVEAVMWGMPAVNFDLMYQAFVGVKGGPNQIAYWSRPLDWKTRPSLPTPTPYTSCRSTTQRMALLCSRFRRPTRAQSPVASMMDGKTRWKMSALPVWIRVRAAST